MRNQLIDTDGKSENFPIDFLTVVDANNIEIEAVHLEQFDCIRQRPTCNHYLVILVLEVIDQKLEEIDMR